MKQPMQRFGKDTPCIDSGKGMTTWGALHRRHESKCLRTDAPSLQGSKNHSLQGPKNHSRHAEGHTAQHAGQIRPATKCSVAAIQPRAHRPQLAVHLARRRAQDERTDRIPTRQATCVSTKRALVIQTARGSLCVIQTARGSLCTSP